MWGTMQLCFDDETMDETCGMMMMMIADILFLVFPKNVLASITFFFIIIMFNRIPSDE